MQKSFFLSFSWFAFRVLAPLVLVIGLFATPLAGQSPQPSPPPTEQAIDDMIKEYEGRLVSGRFPTDDMRKTWWKANEDPSVVLLSRYSGLDSNLVVTLLGGTTDGEERLPKLSAAFDQLGYWTALYTVADKLSQSAPDSRTRSYLANAMKYVGKFLRSRAIGTLINPGVGFLDSTLNSFGERAVSLSKQTWWKAYVEYQVRNHPNDKEWVDLMLKDGGSLVGVIDQLDRFWSDVENVSSDSFFRTNNPDCVRDYRQRYLREKVMPAVKIWAAGEQGVARNGIKYAFRDEGERLRTSSVRIDGTVINYLADFSNVPVSYRVTLGWGGQKETVENQPSYTFVVPLREMKDGSFSINLQPTGQWQRWEVAQGGGSVRIGQPTRTSSLLGVKIKVLRDGNITIRMPEFRIGAIGGQAVNKTLPPGKVDVPAPLDDGIPKIETQGRAAMADYAGRKLSYLDAAEKMKLFLVELDAERERQSRDANAIEQAISRNAEVDSRSFLAQNQGAAANQVQTVAAGLIKEARNRYDERASRNSALGLAWRAWVQKEEEALRQRERDIEARLKAIAEESRLAEKECEENEREMQRIMEVLDFAARASSSGASEDPDFDPFSPERLRYGVPDAPVDDQAAEQKYLELLSSTQEKFDGAYQKMLAQEERIRALLEKYLALNDEMAGHQKQKNGLEASDFPFGAGPSGSNISESFLREWNRRLDAIETLRQTKADRWVKNDLTTTIAVVKRRQPYFAAANADLKRLEELLRSPAFPTADQLRVISEAYDPLAGVAIAYLTAVGQGVWSANPASAIQPGMLDDKGSDATFVRRQHGALRDLIGKNKALCADLLTGAEYAPTDLSVARALVGSLEVRRMYLSRAQRDRFSPLRGQFEDIWQSRRLDSLDRILRAWEFVEPLGTKPSERIQAMLAKNRTQAEAYRKQAQTAAALPKMATSIPAQQKSDLVRQFTALLAEAEACGGLPLECRTLELLTAQSSLLQVAAANGALTTLRLQNDQPLPPRSVVVNRQEIPLDGRLLVFKFADLPPGQQGDTRQLTIVRPASATYRVDQELSGVGQPTWSSWRVDKDKTTVGWKQPPQEPALFILTERCVATGAISSLLPGDPARLVIVVQP